MEDKVFLVEYLNHSKKLTNPTLQNTRELFGITEDLNVFIQYYDREFESFIDTSWEELKSLPSNKLRVCIDTHVPEKFPEAKRLKATCDYNDNYVKLDEPALPFKITVGDSLVPLSRQESADTIVLEFSDQELSEISNSNINLERQNAFCQLKNNLNDVNLNELASTSDSHSSSSKSKRIVTDSDKVCKATTSSDSSTSNETNEINLKKCNKPVTYGNLASSFVLPHINPESKLGKALTAKDSLSKGLKSELLSKIYESFSTKKIFYMGHQSIQVVNALLNAYPHLGRNMTYESAKHYWLRSLNFKFTNERVRTDFAEEAVIAAKASKSNPKPKSAKGSSWWDIPNYFPIRSDDDEDNLAIESHKGWMLTEMKKHSRNESAISIRMNLTFRDRRCLLFKSNDDNPSDVTASDILGQYPCLSIEKEAIFEVNRLFGELKFYENHCKIIRDLTDRFYEHLLSSKCKYKSHLDNLFSSSNSLLAEEQKLLKLPAIISILLSENPKEIIGTELNESHAPMLQITGNKVSLNVDGTTFIEEVSAINASYLWTGAFYTFNIRPTQNKKTFDILQKIIFDIPKSPKWTHTHSKVMDIFNKYLES